MKLYKITFTALMNGKLQSMTFPEAFEERSIDLLIDKLPLIAKNTADSLEKEGLIEEAEECRAVGIKYEVEPACKGITAYPHEQLLAELKEMKL